MLHPKTAQGGQVPDHGRRRQGVPSEALLVCAPAVEGPSSPRQQPSNPALVQDKKRGPEWQVRIPSGPNRLRRETAFLCNIRFRNDLPEVRTAWLPSPWYSCIIVSALRRAAGA